MTSFVCSVFLGIGILLCALRVLKGPKLADRVIAIDLAGILTLALMVTYVHISKELVYLDVSVVLALVGFLGTVVFSRFLDPGVKSAGKKGERS